MPDPPLLVGVGKEGPTDRPTDRQSLLQADPLGLAKTKKHCNSLVMLMTTEYPVREHVDTEFKLDQ